MLFVRIFHLEVEQKLNVYSCFFFRHVLQEMTVDTFIPNDTKILDDGKDAHMSNGGFLSYDNKLIFLSYEQ